MEEILRYKSVKKKNEKATKSISVPDVKWELADDAKEELESKVENVKVKIKGKGQVVVDQSYSIKNNILSVTLQTKEIKSGNEYNIPSLIGKTEAEAKKMLKPYKVDAVFHGEGVIKEQDVEPGEYKTVKEINFWAK
jgi:stage V sporulation protein D (sporulation-specific penicillin-binding protein)